MVAMVRSENIPDLVDVLTGAARCYAPPVLWSESAHRWISAAPPHAPIDPALWRPRMAEWLYALAHEGPEVYGLPDGPERAGGRALSFGSGFLKWHDVAESIRYLSGPITRDLKEILSGDPVFRREAAMTPERWLSLCEQSAGGFTSRADLWAEFCGAVPESAIGQRAFLVLAREVLGRDGRFGPRGAKGPWGFRVTLPR